MSDTLLPLEKNDPIKNLLRTVFVFHFKFPPCRTNLLNCYTYNQKHDSFWKLKKIFPEINNSQKMRFFLLLFVSDEIVMRLSRNDEVLSSNNKPKSVVRKTLAAVLKFTI